MRVAAHRAITVLHERSPAGTPWAIRIIDADTDEAKGRFGEHRRRDTKRERDQNRTDNVGQNMPRHDAPARSAESIGAFDKEKFLGLQHLAARDAREPHP